MSSAEKPYDRKTPPTTFDQWIIDVATLMAVVALVLMTIVHFYVPPTPEQRAASQKQMIEMVCRGETQGPPAYSEEMCGKRLR